MDCVRSLERLRDLLSVGMAQLETESARRGAPLFAVRGHRGLAAATDEFREPLWNVGMRRCRGVAGKHGAGGGRLVRGGGDERSSGDRFLDPGRVLTLPLPMASDLHLREKVDDDVFAHFFVWAPDPPRTNTRGRPCVNFGVELYDITAVCVLVQIIRTVGVKLIIIIHKPVAERSAVASRVGIVVQNPFAPDLLVPECSAVGAALETPLRSFQRVVAPPAACVGVEGHHQDVGTADRRLDNLRPQMDGGKHKFAVIGVPELPLRRARWGDPIVVPSNVIGRVVLVGPVTGEILGRLRVEILLNE
mmetsp:Transcript_127406/g.366382  ORF Transcript_127406/g.366382 Transcript_127406/m.366382 type:complete len:305 (+) Transcript_127406:473-1387(+)